MYIYSIYGLKICSQIRLYNLNSIQSDNIDVNIYYGEIDDDIKLYIDNSITSTMNNKRVWFKNDFGVFVIKNGNEVCITPNDIAKEGDLASFILGWCIAFIFEQRGISAIHCSALTDGNRALLIAGHSGSGKSTMALNLIKKEYKYLADDMAMVDIERDMLIEPAFPMQKVCRDIAEKMDMGKLLYINELKDKFAYINEEDFCKEPKKLTHIFILNVHDYDNHEIEIEELKGIDKLNAVLTNLFLCNAYRALGFTIEEKKRCLSIAGTVKIYSIKRPKDADSVDTICDKIINIFGEEEE